jgi:DNA-binding beta-propeller fold protein YncE
MMKHKTGLGQKIGMAILSLGILCGLFAVVSCGNKGPVPVSPSGSVALSVSLPPSSGAKAALLGAVSNEVYYNITGPAMSPVTGVFGPVTTSGSTGTIAFSLAVPQGSARLMAFQINDGLTHQPLALGAVQADISSQPSSQIVVEMGSLVRNCYNQNTSSFVDGSYFNIGNEVLADAATVTSTTNYDLQFTQIQGIFQMNALNGDTVAYMGNGNLVNFAMAPANGSITATGAAKQTAGAAVTQLQAGDVFCVFIPQPNAHIWIQITNGGSTTVGPSFEFRGNTTLPYFAYQQTPGDLAGPCATPIPTPLVNYPYLTQWGTVGSNQGQFGASGLWSIAMSPSGNIYTTDITNNTIQEFSSGGTTVAMWGGTGTTTGLFTSPQGIAIDSSGNVYVAEYTNNRVQKFTSNGTFITTWGSAGTGNGTFNGPRGIAVDSSGNVYVADGGNDLIQKFTSSGTFITQWGGVPPLSTMVLPWGLAVDASGNVYVADGNGYQIIKYTSTGILINSWGLSGTGNGQFNQNYGVALDAAGNVYVADRANYRVQVFNPNGVYLTQFGTSGSGNGQFNQLSDLVLDPSGNVYVADSVNNRVEVFAP